MASLLEFSNIANVAKNSIPANTDVIAYMRVDVSLLAFVMDHINLIEAQLSQSYETVDTLRELRKAEQSAYDELMEQKNKLQEQLADALQQIEDMKPPAEPTE
ncbi:hypothetical protein QNH04_gp09 [Escherichia phage vB_EcoM_SA91KD]|uniref:hypothetical protein n=1 Tax=Escherichia phage vB_EcoM_SA91KD TaxID=2909742 RepID=UPI0024AE7138|nr:hypothetical protein QNH04_gp09 [Escherichia phage vB_EcoM_SA91KD]UIU26818.1 hypothetical protein SA91KD_09 [Escherichia phage vB_EcoM_SA91KD]